MNDPELNDAIWQVAIHAARAGGSVIAKTFPETPVATSDQLGIGARSKGDKSYDLVSETDEEAERRIVAVIKENFPDHAILAEEGHRATVDSEHLWVVDPLDGTNNFLHGIPHCAVSIAYRFQGETKLGIVFNPMTDDWYQARKGDGATLNGKSLQVSSAKTLDEILVGVGFYYDRGAMMESTLSAISALFRQQVHGIRRLGTASLDLCWVAAGRYGAYFEYELSAWDFAAGELIVTEAGGKVTDARGDVLACTRGSVFASAPGVQEAALELVRHHHPKCE